jgi:transposase InsO family protein
MKQLSNRMDWQTAWQLVGEVATHHASIAVGCRTLGVSRAHLYRLVRRWFEWNQKEPSSEWLSAKRSRRPSSLPENVQLFLRQEIDYLRNRSVHFRDHFNFSVLAQRCHQQFHQRFSRQTIRRWAIQEKLFVPEIHSTAKALRRFDVGSVGELFQHDSSPHLWVPATLRKDALILTIDDHSRRIVGARLVPHDTSWHHLCVVRETVETYGRPLAYYTDNHTIFTPTTDLHAQFSRALYELQIDPRLAGKGQPQAKGKVEKRFDYLQRRIPYLCERYRIKNLTAANRLLDEQVAYYNECHIHAETKETPDQRWKRAVQQGRCQLRELPAKVQLDLIFGLHFKRQLKKDGSLTFKGTRFEIPHGPRYGTIAIILHPPFGRRTYTQVSLLWKGQCLRQFIQLPGRLGWRPL